MEWMSNCAQWFYAIVIANQFPKCNVGLGNVSKRDRDTYCGAEETAACARDRWTNQCMTNARSELVCHIPKQCHNAQWCSKARISGIIMVQALKHIQKNCTFSPISRKDYNCIYMSPCYQYQEMKKNEFILKVHDNISRQVWIIDESLRAVVAQYTLLLTIDDSVCYQHVQYYRQP